MSDTAVVAAPAKLNLYLRVLQARADGYHELDTLFQAMDLADDVSVALRGDRVELEVEGADLGPPEKNLAFLAASRLRSAVGFEGGIKIHLRKRIPVGAGLGGGSSDAAAVLACLARLIPGLDDDPRLRSVAAELGSDVPFFLCGSPFARGRGRGDVLEPLPALPEEDLVLVSPPVHVSTAEAYGALADARLGEPLGDERPPATPGSWPAVWAMARNDFQPVIAEAHREVARALEALQDVGATTALMTGSGSSVFGFFGGRGSSEESAERLTAELGWPCRAVRTLTELPVPRVE